MWLPSGGSLVIDNTEAMTVVDVNTGKFTGQGGNLEETVTRNNLEAAEEIVRQLRLRDVGGIIVIDFIDMVLESNRELVLRRLLECLARDRTKHQVAEVTSLGPGPDDPEAGRVRAAGGVLRAVRALQRARRDHLAGPDRRPSGGRGRGDGRGAKENRQSKGGKNGKESGRRTAEPPATAATRTAVPAARGAAPAEAGADGDAAGEPRPRATAAAGDGAGADGAGADGNGADGRRGAAVRRAPSAPGRHPRAGPARARQPAAGRRVAGWPSVRRSGIKRPGAGSAGAPGRGAWRPGARWPAPGARSRRGA